MNNHKALSQYESVIRKATKFKLVNLNDGMGTDFQIELFGEWHYLFTVKSDVKH
jgi:hypothetical protein